MMFPSAATGDAAKANISRNARVTIAVDKHLFKYLSPPFTKTQYRSFSSSSAPKKQNLFHIKISGVNSIITDYPETFIYILTRR
jgi:hypothetical protein